jgi:mono/diheme cytochrome c family protein
MKTGQLKFTIITIALVCFTILSFCFKPSGSHAGQIKDEAALQLKLKDGERIYREGILPSGEPTQAFVKGDLPVPGTAFTCISCHLRAGIGSVEGGVYTPPTNGKNLYQPLKKTRHNVEVKHGEPPFRRPAYTDKTLAEVIRSGTDPNGKALNDIMPRYMLDDKDMEALIEYLKTLSSQFSPGITDTTIRFATIVSEDANQEESAAMFNALDKFVSDKNGMIKSNQNTTLPRERMMAKTMFLSKGFETRTLTLSRWVLKGSPETWRSQLEEYNRKEPVFALLGGIVSGDWSPVHHFCEENRIPCIFPNTDFPIISESSWYTLYLTKGYYQEGESVARYLNSIGHGDNDGPVVQIVRTSREGSALSSGFEKTWRSLGQSAPVTVTLKAGETPDMKILEKILSGDTPAAVLLWDGQGAGRLIETIAASPHKPAMLFASSSYLGNDFWKLSEHVRDFTYLAYPFRLPQDKVVEPMMRKVITFKVADNKIAKQSFALVELLSMAVMEIKDNYYRDNFLDVIGMSMDRIVPLYERLSFGPGQRYASKGCYIVQLGKGPKPELFKKSDWVIH